MRGITNKIIFSSVLSAYIDSCFNHIEDVLREKTLDKMVLVSLRDLMALRQRAWQPYPKPSSSRVCMNSRLILWWIFCVSCYFQQYIIFMMEVSFIIIWTKILLQNQGFFKFILISTACNVYKYNSQIILMNWSSY